MSARRLQALLDVKFTKGKKSRAEMRKIMLEQLAKIIEEYVDVPKEKITEDARFIEDLGFNSYDFMTMIGEIEEAFDIEVQERDIIQVKTVKDAIEYIKKMQE